MAIIGLDFDGTCVSQMYPFVGESIGAEPVLKTLVKNGHKLILWTMRDNKEHHFTKNMDGESVPFTKNNCLEEAVQWFRDNGIILWGVNENPEQIWSDSNKQYADFYIDDRGLGTPLRHGHVNWHDMVELLYLNGLISSVQKINLQILTK